MCNLVSWFQTEPCFVFLHGTEILVVEEDMDVMLITAVIAKMATEDAARVLIVEAQVHMDVTGEGIDDVYLGLMAHEGKSEAVDMAVSMAFHSIVLL